MVTRTSVTLEVSPVAYEEIHELLEKAGYQHTFNQRSGERETIDMNGIVLVMRRYDTVKEINANEISPT